MKLASRLVLVVLASFLIQSCGPAPRRTLTVEEKTADMYWLYSQFNEYYAPRAYKEQRWGFNYELLKTQYLAEAQATQTNDEFYEVMYRFVATFRDAHTSGKLMNANLPGRAQVAYLGFDGKRQGEGLLVTELMPTIRQDESKFPIKVNDVITKLDGKSLRDVVLQDRVRYRNLGQDESNVSYHMNKIFTRVSTLEGLPTQDNAVLTFTRAGKEMTVTLPWVRQDLVSYAQDQRDALARKGEIPSSSQKVAEMDLLQKLLAGGTEGLAKLIDRFVYQSGKFHFYRGYEVLDDMPTWSTIGKALRMVADTGDTGATRWDELGKERQIPANAVQIVESKTYPMYVNREQLADDKGNVVQDRLVAYLYLDNFTPPGDSDQVVAELKTALRKARSLGANDLVIDLLNNGGGDLLFGSKVAQLLTADLLVQPQIQFKISDDRLDEFQTNSLSAASPAEKERARRVYSALLEQRSQRGMELSAPFDAGELLPFGYEPNADLASGPKLHVALMVNELCGSMCEIFSGMLQDNGIAKVVGTRTVGAGGNVVEHFQAPNSHFQVRQTESLLLRRDGSYLENNGVTPDVATPVNETVADKYEPVRKKAVQVLLSM